MDCDQCGERHILPRRDENNNSVLASRSCPVLISDGWIDRTTTTPHSLYVTKMINSPAVSGLAKVGPAGFTRGEPGRNSNSPLFAWASGWCFTEYPSALVFIESFDL